MDAHPIGVGSDAVLQRRGERGSGVGAQPVARRRLVLRDGRRQVGPFPAHRAGADEDEPLPALPAGHVEKIGEAADVGLNRGRSADGDGGGCDAAIVPERRQVATGPPGRPPLPYGVVIAIGTLAVTRRLNVFG